MGENPLSFMRKRYPEMFEILIQSLLLPLLPTPSSYPLLLPLGSSWDHTQNRLHATHADHLYGDRYQKF